MPLGGTNPANGIPGKRHPTIEDHVVIGSGAQVALFRGGHNAVTGEQGTRAVLSSTQAVAKALGISPEEILPASTGVIGAHLPVDDD